MGFVKETVGIILIIVFVILIEIITAKITNSSLEKLDNKIVIIEKQEKEEDLKESITNLSRIWENEEKKLSCYMEHDELEDISKNVDSLVFCIENNEKDSIKEKLNEIKFKMEHIKNKQKIKLKNIF